MLLKRNGSRVVRALGLGLAIVCSAVLGACSREDAATGRSLPARILEARKANITPAQYIKPGPHADSKDQRTLLLFVHGIFGDTIKTWCNANRTCLYDLILSSPEFADNYDAFVFGFPSSVVKKGSFNIPEAAKSLHSEIRFRQFTKNYKQIVIVAHSMGGLVTLELLTSYGDVAQKVPLVVTYATPYDGSQVAALGARLLENPALRDMVPLDKENSLLVSLSNRWRESRDRLPHPTKIICAYEKIEVPPLFASPIVPPASAMALCDEPADPIPEDHIGIVKPDGVGHASFKILVNALRELNERASDTFVDVSIMALLAPISDPALRLDIYKRLANDPAPSPATVDFVRRLHLSGNHQATHSVSIQPEQATQIQSTAALRVVSQNFTAAEGLPCGGVPDFHIADGLLSCKNGMPITIVESPKTGGLLTAHKLVVFHATASVGLRQTLAELMRPDMAGSAHVLIDRDGTLVQMVPFDRVAHHAGVSSWQGRTSLNRSSIGIEFVNAGQLDRSGEQFINAVHQQVPAEEVEQRAGGEAWQKFTEAQINVAIAVGKAIAGTYGEQAIVGHCHVSQGRKIDPGPYFPFAKIEGALGISETVGPCPAVPFDAGAAAGM